MRPAASKAFPRQIDARPGNVGIAHVPAIKRLAPARAAPAIEPHTHDQRQIEFHYLVKGEQTHKVAGRRHMLTGGHILMIRPGEKHSSSGEPEEKGLRYCLVLQVPQHGERFLGLPARQARGLLDAVKSIHLRLFRGSPPLQTHLDAAIRLLQEHHGDPVDVARIQSHIVLFLGELLSCAARHLSDQPSVWRTRALAFIHNQGDVPLSVSAMAAHMGVSRTQFAVRFRREVGVSPGEYCLRQRVLRARERLRGKPACTITEIAMAMGFPSSQYFATVFRRYTGTTPRQFRSAAGDFR